MSKDKQIKIIIDLLERSDYDYVENVFKLLIQNDISIISKVLDKDDYETLKDMILEEEKED